MFSRSSSSDWGLSGIPVLLHELLEVRLLAVGPLLEHVVELGHHVLHAGHVLGGDVLHGPGHLVELLLHQLLPELLEQVVEALLGLVRLELVVLQASNLAGQVVGQHVELHLLGRRCLLGQLGIPGGLLRRAVLAVPGSVVSYKAELEIGQRRPVVEGLALLVDEIGQLVVDLVVHTAEIVVRQAFLALLAELVHDLPQTLDSLTVAVLESLLHEPPQRRHRVAVVHEIVRQLGQHVEGVEIEALLGAVPPGVAETLAYHVPRVVPHPRRHPTGPARARLPSLG